MATDDREIFVDAQYPIPPFVDGIIRVLPENPETPTDWTDVPDLPSVSVEEGTGEDEQVQVPTPLEVIEQKAVSAKGGGTEVNAILVIEEVPGVSDYEIRVVMR